MLSGLTIEGMGFDFGTYNTKIAILYKNAYFPKILNLGNVSEKDGIVPSFIKIMPKKVIGRIAKKNWIKGDENVFFRFKLGIGKEEEKEKICKEYLSEFNENLAIGKEKNFKICFTYPNGWHQGKNEIYKKILTSSGFEKSIFFMKPEPYTAGLFLLEELNKSSGWYLVVDVGAGTFDVSLLKKTEDGIEVKTHLDAFEELAGSHIDEMIASFITKQKISYNAEDIDIRKLLDEVERAKIQINNNRKVKYPVHYKDSKIYVDEKIIREACKDFLDRAKYLLSKIKEKLNINLNGIIPAGGSGYFFLLIEVLQEIFKDVPILKRKSLTATSDDSIPLGAAMAASERFKIFDRNKFPLCIRFRKGLLSHEHIAKIEKKEFSLLESGERLYVEIVPKDKKLPSSLSTQDIFEILKFYGGMPEIDFCIMEIPLIEIKNKERSVSEFTKQINKWNLNNHEKDKQKLNEIGSKDIHFNIKLNEDRTIELTLMVKKDSIIKEINTYTLKTLEGDNGKK